MPAPGAAPVPAAERDSEDPGEAILSRVLASLDDDKAEDVVPVDLRGRSTIADHMVVASGRSTRQVAAIAEKLLARLKACGVAARAEGLAAADWVLIDAGDVIVHVFRPEVREFYQIEKMWAPAGAALHRAVGSA
jgi:ribosome-associated protein